VSCDIGAVHAFAVVILPKVVRLSVYMLEEAVVVVLAIAGMVILAALLGLFVSSLSRGVLLGLLWLKARMGQVADWGRHALPRREAVIHLYVRR
jgi:hypothetical protein